MYTIVALSPGLAWPVSKAGKPGGDATLNCSLLHDHVFTLSHPMTPCGVIMVHKLMGIYMGRLTLDATL